MRFLRNKADPPQCLTSSSSTHKIKIEKFLPPSKALHLYDIKHRSQVLLVQERILACLEGKIQLLIFHAQSTNQVQLLICAFIEI